MALRPTHTLYIRSMKTSFRFGCPQESCIQPHAGKVTSNPLIVPLPHMPDPALTSDIANRSLHAFPGSTGSRPKFSGQHSREPLFWHSPPTEETEVTLVCFIEENGRMLSPGEPMRPDVPDSSGRVLMQQVDWGAMGRS